ncbi:hypothetical protein VQH23_16500 [Pararoseomonas sp. SCSIO 73927]|uniref:hypothetical protein n=1 Tax=Pararoseomonas sp. SCSIO 73927 TaxID=3114537 RepID=UPI0030D275C8
MTLRRALLPALGLLLAAASGPAAAQAPAAPAATQAPAAPAATLAPDAVQEERAQSSIVLTLPQPGGGEARSYTVEDISISLSRAGDPRGDAGGADIGISLIGLRPLDAALLEWLRQDEAGAASYGELAINVSTPQASGPAATTRYGVEGGRVLAFSISHSGTPGASQMVLQLTARRLIMNGVPLN